MNRKAGSYRHLSALLALSLLLIPKFISAQTPGTLDPTEVPERVPTVVPIMWIFCGWARWLFGCPTRSLH